MLMDSAHTSGGSEAREAHTHAGATKWELRVVPFPWRVTDESHEADDQPDD